MQHTWIQKYCFPAVALVIALVTWHAVETKAERHPSPVVVQPAVDSETATSKTLLARNQAKP